jgi:hypothetical protein
MKADTFSMIIPTDYILRFDERNFYKSEINKHNAKIVNYSLDKKPFGIETLSINETYGRLKLRVNSKILGKEYYKLIQPSTLDQVLNKIQKAGIKLDPEFLNKVNLREIHITDDILVSDPSSTISALNHLVASKFIKTLYPEGIVFKERIRNGLYFTAYGKQFEIKQNTGFFKQNPELIKHFENKIRLETKLRSRLVNKYTGASLLPDILSKVSPNGQIMHKIIDNQLLFKTDLITNLNWKEQQRLAIAKLLKDQFNGDFKMIEGHLRKQLGKNTKPNYLINQIKESMFKLLNTEHQNIFDPISELLGRLNYSELGLAA